jgi:outer membrane protein assembly factor BamB
MHRSPLTGLWVLLCLSASAAVAEPQPGDPAYAASPDHPVGWRGDGTGRFPGANPPTTWERKAIPAGGYTTKNILWAAPLPNIGVSSPIVIGDRIFLLAEASDVVCLDKQTGKTLWIRSNPEYEALAAEVKQANPAIGEKLLPLSAELAKANEEVIAALNAELPSAATAAFHQPGAALKKKRAIEKQILDTQKDVDKKLFSHNWGQAVFGYGGTTPVSDGKRVFAFFTTGVTVCYDLEGNRKWIARGTGDGSEHGNFASPILCGNQVVVWANEMRSYDADTGKLLWTNPAKAFNTYGSMFKVKSGDEWVACFQWGFFTRIRDGQAVWDQKAFGDSVSTPIVEGDIIFAMVGYPRPEKEKGLKAFRIPPSTDTGKLNPPAYAFDTNWADDEMVIDKKKNPFDRGMVASPLFVDGLIYQVNQGGGLTVNDAATGAQVYRKVLPLKPKTEYWNWAGCGASPTLAGKFVYLMDNQGTTLVTRPGKTFDLVATNVIEELRDNKQAQNLATPVFDGSRMYYRTPGFLYCIGEK